MQTGASSFTGPESILMGAIKESKNDIDASQVVVDRAKTLLSSIYPSNIRENLQERLNIVQAIDAITNNTNSRISLTSQASELCRTVGLVDNGPIYGILNRNNAEVQSKLETAKNTSEECKIKIGLAMQITKVHEEIKTMRTP